MSVHAIRMMRSGHVRWTGIAVPTKMDENSESITLNGTRMACYGFRALKVRCHPSSTRAFAPAGPGLIVSK
jgi:hypothetical protein